METLEYVKRQPAMINETSVQPESVIKEEIITIDSQIELKVRGDLPEAKVLNSAIDFVDRKMTTFLQYEYELFKRPQYALLDGVIHYCIEKKEDNAFEELKRIHLAKFSEMAAERNAPDPKSKFLFSIDSEFEIIIPPYDTGWTNSFGTFSGANKISGAFNAAPLANDYGAAGIGVFFSPTHNMKVNFRPHCPVSFSWSNLINDGGGFAASRGGIGLTIYDATLGILVKDDHDVLWNQSRKPSSQEISGSSDDVYFQNTSIGHSTFEMKVGHAYLVWMWCWVFTDSGPNAAAYASVDCKVPFMIVDASTL